MRVHELAKATGLESKEILAIAKRHRLIIKPNPSANIEDKDVRRLMPLIDKYKADIHAKEAEEQQRKEAERHQKEEERRRLLDEKRKAEEEEHRRKEEEARREAQRKAE
ncbi:MAG: translation initiation factor IF-2, partial [bacterium]